MEKPMLLLVDDNIQILELLKKVLKDSYDVQTATTGTDALTLSELFNFDLIVCDLNLPGADGITVVRKLRAKGNQVPVIFLSGEVTMGSMKSALRLEVSDVLEKPVKASELIKSITKTLQLQSAKTNHQEKMVGLLQVTRECV